MSCWVDSVCRPVSWRCTGYQPISQRWPSASSNGYRAQRTVIDWRCTVAPIQRTPWRRQQGIDREKPRTRPNRYDIASVDATRIEQVMLNLLSNAIKYSPAADKITIDYRVAVSEEGWQLRAMMERPMGRNRGAVITGSAFRMEQQSLIFGRFVRADNAREAGISGSGLGLYISRGLIEQHGGDLWFDSQRGEGNHLLCDRAPRTNASRTHDRGWRKRRVRMTLWSADAACQEDNEPRRRWSPPRSCRQSPATASARVCVVIAESDR